MNIKGFASLGLAVACGVFVADAFAVFLGRGRGDSYVTNNYYSSSRSHSPTETYMDVYDAARPSIVDPCKEGAAAIEALGEREWMLYNTSTFGDKLTFFVARAGEKKPGSIFADVHSLCVTLPTEIAFPKSVKVSDGKLVSAD